MTYEQYWDGDPELVKYYRKAHKIKFDEENTKLWLQGMYIYEALCDVSPIYHDFAKPGTKAMPYSTKPYALDSESSEKQKEEKERKEYDKGIAYMEARMAELNAKFKPPMTGDDIHA